MWPPAEAHALLDGGEESDCLPVQRFASVEVVINHQSARMLGLAVPPLLLGIADEVIE